MLAFFTMSEKQNTPMFMDSERSKQLTDGSGYPDAGSCFES